MSKNSVTVGSRLFELRLFISERLDVAMFLAVAGKRRSSHWSSATGKAKLLYERLFPNATTPFHPVRDLDHDSQCLSY